VESVEVVDPRQQKRRDQVFFCATVSYATDDGTENTITIAARRRRGRGFRRVTLARFHQRASDRGHPADLAASEVGFVDADARSARNPLRRRRWRDMLKRRIQGHCGKLRRALLVSNPFGMVKRLAV
jgi:hypothetical protein